MKQEWEGGEDKPVLRFIPLDGTQGLFVDLFICTWIVNKKKQSGSVG